MNEENPEFSRAELAEVAMIDTEEEYERVFPEHTRLREVGDRSQAIHEFLLEFMPVEGYDRLYDAYKIGKGKLTELVAKFLGIDPPSLEREKRLTLAAVREFPDRTILGSIKPKALPAPEVDPFEIATIKPVLAEVEAERYSQEQKWGQQNHDPFTYMAILMEEVGEMAEAALRMRYGKTAEDIAQARVDYRGETVQTAAVAAAMVECVDRGLWRWPTKTEPVAPVEDCGCGDS